MNRNRIMLIIPILIIVIPVAEIAREELAYNRYSSQLRDAYPNIRSGMTREKIISVLGAPDVISGDEPDNILQWDAIYHQGWLRKKIGFSREKGHYGINVAFDKEGRAMLVWAGVE